MFMSDAAKVLEASDVTGETVVKSYREAISDALWEEMERDQNIVMLGEEIGVWGGTYAVTRGFYDHFGPKRILDTPIAEAAIVGFAIGAAMNGLRPIAELMTINFAFVAFDAIVNLAPKVHPMFGGQFKAPLVIRTTTGGGRQLGATHSHSPEPIFAHFPGLIVACPYSPHDAKGMLKAAIRNDNPVLFVEHSTLYQRRGPVPTIDYEVPLGVSDIKREGTDVTIVSYSKMVEISLNAADMLEKEGISAEVVDLRCLRPLDMGPVLESFRKTNHCVVVEEAHPMYSVGSEVAAQIQEHAFDWMDAPVKRVSTADAPLPYARELEQSALPSPEKVVAAVKEIL